ncbi:carbohydrate esterase family 4 protein, partial [Backusella circina FSU 941]
PTNPEWMKNIDFTNIKGNVRPITSGKCSAAKCDGSDNNDCYQVCGCLPHSTDVFGCTIPKTWSLTFDDGPSEVTPVLLDILKSKGVKATFCVLGAYAEKYPDILRRIYDEGHQIASHTYSHAHLMSLTNEEIVNEMRATDEVVQRITGVTPRYARPPFGEADERVKALLEQMGYKILMWNVDPHDYNFHMVPNGGDLIQDGFQEILDGKSNMYNVFNEPGYISLQHDLYGPSIQQVDKIIDLVKSYGYDMMPVNMCTGQVDMH